MDDSQAQTQATNASAEALVDNANRLGLTWELRPATVGLVFPDVTVQVDGDSEFLTATSMIGKLVQGQRVFVILVPPSGIFVVGITGNALIGRPIGSAFFAAGTTAGSTGAEVALSGWGASTTFYIEPLRVARLVLTCGINTNSAAVTAQQLRIRKTFNSTSSTQLGFSQHLIAAGSSGFTLSTITTSYIRNSTTATVAFSPGVTNQKSLGTGTNSIFGDNNIPITLLGFDVGDTRDTALASIVVLATQV